MTGFDCLVDAINIFFEGNAVAVVLQGDYTYGKLLSTIDIWDSIIK